MSWSRRASALGAIFLIVLGAGIAAAEPVPEGMSVYPQPRPIPQIKFQDDAKEVLTLEDFRGKVVVLNLWATWCPPCREEMPTLDALQGELGSERFEVMALSIDRAGPQIVRDFYEEIGIEHLRLYIDPSTRTMGTLGIPGIPTTLIVGPEVRELGRLVGAVDWASGEMLTYFQGLIEQFEKGDSQ